MTNQFHNSGPGEQNIAQGHKAIGKQNNFFYRLLGRIFTSGNQSPAIVAEQGNVTVTYNNSVIPPQRLEELAGKLAVTESALASFFKILEQQQVPLHDLDSKLREIAAQYKELLARLDSVKSEDLQVVKLKQEAKQAIEAGDYAKAEELLNQAEALDLKAIAQMEKTAKQRRISAAATNADQASLQRIQLRYAKAAEYWQKAAALLPEEEKKDRAYYLHNAAFDLDRIAEYTKALPLYEQSLVIRKEIGDRAGEGTTLSNIGAIHHAKGDYAATLKYLEQSLDISQEIGDRRGEGVTLNNLATLAYAKGDYAAALKYLEQSLAISQEIGDRAGEGTTLNNIAGIHWARGDYAAALTYLEQSLVISKEIGDRRGEAETSWNIGLTYEEQGDLVKAEQHISRAVLLAEEIGHPKLEYFREGLERVRAKLRGE